ncbi:MAG: hypothetical protein H7296_04265 [Bacteroidia bacterium]|nr:hypothetical protein [Bacteroidia bacterium]
MKTLITKIAICICAISSCNVAYRSTMLNTPLFSAKKEIAIAATTTNFQAAYSVTDHIGVMANGYFEQQDAPIDRVGNGGKGFLGEIGAGYFRKIYPKPEIIFETYGGIGYGHMSQFKNYSDPMNGFAVQQRSLTANGLKMFIQPAIGYKLRLFEISAGLRYSNISYLNIKTKNWPVERLYDDHFDELNLNYSFIEPAITLRAGIRNVKIQFQYLYCIKLSNGSINYNKELYSLGIFIKIHTGKYFPPLMNRP